MIAWSVKARLNAFHWSLSLYLTQQQTFVPSSPSYCGDGGGRICKEGFFCVVWCQADFWKSSGTMFWLGLSLTRVWRSSEKRLWSSSSRLMTVLCQAVWFWIPIASVKLCNHSFSVFLSPSFSVWTNASISRPKRFRSQYSGINIYLLRSAARCSCRFRSEITRRKELITFLGISWFCICRHRRIHQENDGSSS